MPNVYIENKFSGEVIEMNISNAINTVSVSGSSSSSAKKTSEKNKWQLTDSLKKKLLNWLRKMRKTMYIWEISSSPCGKARSPKWHQIGQH